MKINTKKTNVTRKLIAFILAIAVAFNFIPIVNNAKAYKKGDVITSFTYADKNAYNKDGIIASFTYGDGVTRNLEVRDGRIYLDDIVIVPISYIIDEIGFDKYGQIWVIDKSAKYDITWGYINPYTKVVDYGFIIWNWYYSEFSDISEGDRHTINDASSLVYDEKGFVVGYKDGSGVTQRTLNFDEIKNVYNRYGVDAYDFSTYVSEEIVTTETPASTEDNFAKPNIVKDGKEYAYYRTINKQKVSDFYTFSKNVLSYNSKTYRNVKEAGFIKESGNVIYITKKGQAYTITSAKKKKTLLKKNAKSLVKDSDGFVTKIKKKSGTVKCERISNFSIKAKSNKGHV